METQQLTWLHIGSDQCFEAVRSVIGVTNHIDTGIDSWPRDHLASDGQQESGQRKMDYATNVF